MRLNRTLILGVLIGISVIVTGLALEIDGASPRVFFHPVAILIVFGGCIAGAMISLPAKELARVVTRTYYTIRNPKDDYMGTLRDILRVSIGFNKDVLYLEKLDAEVANLMFRDGLSMVAMGFKGEDIRRLLEIKKEQNEAALSQCSVLFFGISKMGPAFGLLGTLVGLVILLYYHMGAGNMEKVASSMGVALTATLYGVGVSNLIFQPLAEYLQYNTERGATLDAMVIEGVVQIRERRHPIYLAQTLKAYVPREDYAAIDRIMQQEMTSGKASGTAAPVTEAAA